MAPIWISHRGIHTKFTENTKEAFKAALDGGFQVLETDLRISLDGHIVLSHDPTLERIGGNKTPISKLSRLDIERVRFHKNEKPMFLDEFLSEFHESSWLFDIKPENGFFTIQKFIELIKENFLSEDLTKKAKFLFWSKEQEKFFLKFFPKAHCYADKVSCWQAGISSFLGIASLGLIKSQKTYSLPPKIYGYYLYRNRIIECYKKSGAKLVAFLPKEKDEIMHSIMLEFDEILLDSEIPSEFRK